MAIINANALSIPLASGTVQCCITSPPYWGLRSYLDNDDPNKAMELGLEPTPEEYVANMVAVFREVRRVLRPDGVCWLNLGDSYNGSGGAGGDYAAGGLKEGQPRYPGRSVGGLKPKDLVGIPWRVAFALQADGWWLRSDIIWSKPNPMPESVTDRPTKAHEYIFLLTKRANYYYDAEAVKEDSKTEAGLSWNERKEKGATKNAGVSWRNDVSQAYAGKLGNGSTRNRRTVWTIPTSPYSGSHFATFPPDLVRPCILAGSSPRACEHCGAPWERVVDHKAATPGQKPGYTRDTGVRNDGERAGHFIDASTTTTGWRSTCTCDNQGTGRCIVLDPFAGTFTVGMVAAEYGRRAVGIELNPEYIKLAKERTGAAMAQEVMQI